MRRLSFLYNLNATLLLCHEIDSAYWHEWELFHQPGGVTGFVWLHVPIIWVMIQGALLLHTGEQRGLWYALVVAGAGIVGVILHGSFLLAGSESFRTVSSIALIGAFGLASMAQLALSIRELRARRDS